MATVLDNLGRKIDVTNMTLDQIKGMISSLMSSKVGEAKPVEKPAQPAQEKHDNLFNLMKDYIKDFESDAEEQKKLLNQVVSTMKDVLVKAKEAKEKQAKEPKKKKIVTPTLGKMNGLPSTKSMVKVYDIRVVAAIDKLAAHISNVAERLCRCIRKDSNRNIAQVYSNGGGHGGHGGHGGYGHRSRIYGDGDDVHMLGRSSIKIMSHHLENLSEKAQKNILGYNPWDRLFDGVIKDEREFTQEMRQIGLQTANVTKDSGDLQKVFERIDLAESMTNVDRTKFQQAYKKAVKGGIKDLKLANALTREQLHIEKYLGMEAGSLGEEFRDWLQAGKMSISQIAEMGRGMRIVAKNTGVTGDELNAAVKSSQALIKNMRNAGNFSTTMAKNMLEFTTNARKLDVESAVSDLQKALSDPFYLDFEMEPNAKAMLYDAANRATKIAQNEGKDLNIGKMLRTGTILENKEAMSLNARGLEEHLLAFASGLKTVHGKAVTSMEDLHQMDADQRATFMKSFQVAHPGRQLGEMMRVIEAYKDSSKTLADRIADLQSKYAGVPNAGKLINDERRTLEIDAGMSILGSFHDASKGAKNMAETMTMWSKTKKDNFKGDLGILGTTGVTDTETLRNTIYSTFDKLNASLEESGKDKIKLEIGEVEAALKSPAALEALKTKFDKAQEGLNAQISAGQDPISESEKHLREINANIRKISQGFFSKLFDSIGGKLVVIAAILVSIASALTFKLVNLANSLETLREFTRFLSAKAGLKMAPAAHAAASGGRAAKATLSVKTFLTDIRGFIRTGFNHVGDIFESTFEKLATKVGKGFDVLATRGVTGLVKDGFSKTFNIMSRGWSAVYGNLSNIAYSLGTTLRNIGIGLQRTYTSALTGAKEIGTKIADLRQALKGKTIAQIFSEGVEKIKGTKMVAGAKNTWLGMKNALKGKSIGTILAEGISGSFKSIKGVMASGTKIVGTGVSGLLRGFGQLGGGLLRMAGKLSPLTLAFIAVDGLIGALDAGSKAGKIFSKDLKDVTLNQEYAAKSAGMLTGILNGLTLGLFGLFFGKELDELTASIARGIAKIPALTVVLGTIVVALEATWGLIKGVALGIWEIAKGLFDGVMEIVNPIVEGFSAISEAIGNALSPEMEQNAGFLVRAFRDLGGVIGIVSKPIQALGWLIGSVLRVVGKIIGFVIKSIFSFVEGFMVVFEPVGEVLAEVGAVFGELFEILSDVFKEISVALGPLGKDIVEFFRPVYEFFTGGDTTEFFALLKEAGKQLGWLVGNVLRVMLWQVMLLVKTISAIAKVVSGIVKLFKGDWSGAWDSFKAAGGAIMEGLLWPLKAGFPAVVDGFFKFFTESIPAAIDGFFKFFTESIPAAINGFFKFFTEGIPAFVAGFFKFFIDSAPAFIETFFKIFAGAVPAFVSTFFKIFTEAVPAFVSFFYESIRNAMGGVGDWLMERLGLKKKDETERKAATEQVKTQIKEATTVEAAQKAIETSRKEEAVLKKAGAGQEKFFGPDFYDSQLKKLEAMQQAGLKKIYRMDLEKRLAGKTDAQKQEILVNEAKLQKTLEEGQRETVTDYVNNGKRRGLDPTQLQKDAINKFQLAQENQRVVRDMQFQRRIDDAIQGRTGADLIKSLENQLRIEQTQMAGSKKLIEDSTTPQNMKRQYANNIEQFQRNIENVKYKIYEQTLLEQIRTKKTVDEVRVLLKSELTSQDQKLAAAQKIVDAHAKKNSKLPDPEEVRDAKSEIRNIERSKALINGALEDIDVPTGAGAILKGAGAAILGEPTTATKIMDSTHTTAALDTNAALQKIKVDSETTAETMKMGQQVGSIYVHDVHTESVLEKILSTLGLSNGLEHLKTMGDALVSRMNPLSIFEKPEAEIKQSIVSTVVPNSPLTSNIHTAVASEKASTEPVKAEVMAPELEEIADESGKQTVLLENLCSLITDLIKEIRPNHQVITSITPNSPVGHTPAIATPNKVTEKRPNFHRNTVGLVSQTAGRSVLNVGTPTK